MRKLMNKHIALMSGGEDHVEFDNGDNKVHNSHGMYILCDDHLCFLHH